LFLPKNQILFACLNEVWISDFLQNTNRLHNKEERKEKKRIQENGIYQQHENTPQNSF
jgi:hypothetical protein